nr:probable inactive receptor kinase At5g10020 [Ipomoea trifida]
MQMLCAICLILLSVLELVLGRSDLEALLEVKKGFQEDPSGKVLVSWDSKSLASNGCPQDWYGISCSEGHVTSIVLNDVGLVGVLDFPAIGNLKLLRNLSVANNQLRGNVTAEIGAIESLEYLDLSQNMFSGSIPSEFTGLKNLVFLNFSLNNMEGGVPSGFDSLEQLMYLDLHSNAFSGDVTSLLSQLGGVVYVDISGNEFFGSLDLEVGIGGSGFVSTVQYLNISHNKLTGELFPHDGMPYFDSLEVFDASNNQFVGNLPSFNFIVSLQILRLGNNKLSGSLPQGLLQKSSMVLSELDISLNELEGPIGNINAENLKVLNLSSNKLSGPLPVRVGRCAVIDLSNNMLSGNVSRIQGWGNNVEVITLSSNLLVGSLSSQTSQFLRLTSLKISNNSLDGTLPPILCTYPELKTIDLSTNVFSGPLPACLFNSSRLSNVNLSSNKFTGTIPMEELTPQNPILVSLDLSHNVLSGHLPPELNRFPNIESLDLSDNNFEGGIPDGLSETLKTFNVSGNNLSGPVPKNLLRFPNSAFHPGNSLLEFPHEEILPNGNSNLNPVRRGRHIKSAVRAALIAGLVVTASVVALLIVLIYCKIHHVDSGKANPKGSNEKKGSPLSAGPEIGNQGLPVPVRQNEALSSPISVMSSANISPSRIQDPSKSPNSLKVSSPDKMAGSLHLFDSTLKFTAEDLSCAPAEAVGTSCHGTLYKAVLGSGHVLAVKWLKEGILKNRKDFAREVKKLGNITHPNLVSLLGYYWGPKDHERLIISNYVNSPCLALYLHDKNSKTLNPLSLVDRLKIAVDVARCLCYLHHESAIPHGNLKSTNILVETSTHNALLTDYSLHRIMTSAGTAEQVLTAAALGYRPPEFASTSKPCPSLKGDVYAFGVILLELLTGRNSAEIVPGNAQVLDLTEWVRLLAAQNRSLECFDPSVLGTGSMERVYAALDDMLCTALRCILPADERPDMRVIFEELSSVSVENNTTEK